MRTISKRCRRWPHSAISASPSTRPRPSACMCMAIESGISLRWRARHRAALELLVELAATAPSGSDLAGPEQVRLLVRNVEANVASVLPSISPGTGHHLLVLSSHSRTLLLTVCHSLPFFASHRLFGTCRICATRNTRPTAPPPPPTAHWCSSSRARCCARTPRTRCASLHTRTPSARPVCCRRRVCWSTFARARRTPSS